MQRCTVLRRPFCLSVCLSVCQTLALWQNEKETCAHILIPHERSFILVFSQEEWLVGAIPSMWNFGANWFCWSENADFQSIFSRSASAVTPSEKSSINTNRKSTTSFPISLRWTLYVSPKSPKLDSKTQNGRFRCKIALHLKKVCYKVSLCECSQRQSFNSHSVIYLSVQKWLARDVTLKVNFLFKWTAR